MKPKSILSLSIISGLFLACLGFAPVAHADDAQLMTMVQSLQSEMTSLKKTVKQQNAVIKDLQKGKKKKVVAPASKGAELPSWMDGLKFKGDFRLRYEALEESGAAIAADRNRFRYRLRFGFEKKFSDEWKIGFRLASAPSTARDSTNTTLDTNFSFKDISIDKAWATYTPNWGKDLGIIEKTEITAGKFGNPLKKYTSFMVWDGDVTPEGIYEKFSIQGWDTEDFDTDFNAIFGQWVLEEGGGIDNDDAEMFVWHVNANSKLSGITEKPIGITNAFTFYDTRDFVNGGNFAAAGGNFTTDGGGRLAAQNFRVIEVYNALTFQLGDLPKTKIYFDWAHNIANDAVGKVLGEGQENAWDLGLKLGSAKKKGSWQASYNYVWLEANAVPGAFSDSDFNGTNQRGSVIKAKYMITDYLTLGFAAFFTNNITSGNPAIGDQERRLFQTDLIWKF